MWFVCTASIISLIAILLTGCVTKPDRPVPDGNPETGYQHIFKGIRESHGVRDEENPEFLLAVEACTKAIELHPNIPYAYDCRASAYVVLHQYEKAISDFTKAISLDPTRATFYGSRGATYIFMKRFDLALSDYDKVVSLKPLDAESYFNRGTLHEKMDQKETAIQDYQKTLKIKPDHKDANERLEKLGI